MFDPTIGRWTTEDPIGFEAADADLFRYVRNNPTNAIDPSGRNITVGQPGTSSAPKPGGNAAPRAESPRGKLIDMFAPCRGDEADKDIFKETDASGSSLQVRCESSNYVARITYQKQKPLPFGKCVFNKGQNCFLITYDEKGQFDKIRWYNFLPKGGEKLIAEAVGKAKTKASTDPEGAAADLRKYFELRPTLFDKDRDGYLLLVYVWDSSAPKTYTTFRLTGSVTKPPWEKVPNPR
jgi:hypothetical protein